MNNSELESIFKNESLDISKSTTEEMIIRNKQ